MGGNLDQRVTKLTHGQNGVRLMPADRAGHVFGRSARPDLVALLTSRHLRIDRVTLNPDFPWCYRTRRWTLNLTGFHL
jgi:hypothetical protein